jgi:exonuclease SbcC
MIPLRLELRNFMAYREADPLDLTGLHVVCLSGENGAGKSALLDALSWALWGKARANRDDELISQGESEMRVALTFSEGSNVFQVVRTRKLAKATARGKTAASSGTLDLLIEDQGSWRSLSEPRQSDTQAKIVSILNLTHDTFINSAYLKQGRADEFTLRTPAERKALLAEILSLDVWQGYEEKVKQQQQAAESALSVLRFELKKTEDEIGRLPQYERELEAAQAASHNAAAALEQAEAGLAEVNRQRERARALQAQLARAAAQSKAIRAEQDGLAAEQAGHQRQMQAYRTALDRRDEIAAGYADYEAARERDAQFNLKLTSLVELNARKTAAEAALAEARRDLAGRRDLAAARLRELEPLADVAAWQAQMDEAEAALAELAAVQGQRDARLRELGDARERQAGAKAENDELRRRMNELKARITALSRVGAICPTCGRELAEADRVRILADWEAQGKAMGDQYRANTELAERLAAQRRELDEAVEQADRILARLPGAQREASALQERLARAAQAAGQLPAARAELERAQAVLNADDYAPEARQALAEVNRELEALGYDAAAHRELREAILPRLEAFVERKRELDRADLGVESERRALEALELRMQAVAQRRAAEEAAEADLQRDLAACQAALQRAPEVETVAQRARSEFFAAQRKVGEANQRVQACLSLAGSRERLNADIDAWAKKQSLLADLRTAFGKNGVPAMIIEAVLPELEETANALLGRLTNQRMSVRFETQRATLRGDVSETLELHIRDDLGWRPYEMFSGGEAFRINFGVRIALSQLLARRAGARLQTLIIDEGFGTQDAQGRERLVEAIRSIEDDFERIFIVTHIDELRDAFPSRIEVAKTANGSRARLV